MFNIIRAELRRIHGILKHGETAAESVAHEKLGALHDSLFAAEAHQVVIAAQSVTKLRALPGAAEALGKEETSNIDVVLKHAADLKAKVDAEQAQIDARSKAAAAKEALTPETEKKTKEKPKAPAAGGK